MANPIKETPTVYGESAKRFLKQMETVQPWPQDRIDELKKAYTLYQEMKTGYRKFVY